MAEKAKKQKKHKYTRRNVVDKHLENKHVKFGKVQGVDSIKALLNDMNQVNPVEPRASESSYVFVCGNKVLIRNLTDEMLNERLDQTFISACEARRLANQLEQLEYNLSLEQRYRGLK